MKNKKLLLIAFFVALFVFQQAQAGANTTSATKAIPQSDMAQSFVPYCDPNNPADANRCVYVRMYHIVKDINGNTAGYADTDLNGNPIECDPMTLDSAFGCTDAAGTNYSYPYPLNPAYVDLENDYLLDVLSREMDPHGNPQEIAQHTQAIAARSFAYYWAKSTPSWIIQNAANLTRGQVFIPYAFDNYLSTTQGNINIPDNINEPCKSGNLSSYQASVCKAVSKSDNGFYVIQHDNQAYAKTLFFSDWVGDTISDGSSLPYLQGVSDPISTGCDPNPVGHGWGMSQKGASRWVLGNQCAQGGSEATSWPVKWDDPRQILAHYYPGIDILNANGEKVAPDNRWNLLKYEGIPSQIVIGQPAPQATVWLQNTSTATWTDAVLGYQWINADPLIPPTAWVETALPEMTAGMDYKAQVTLSPPPMDGTYTLRFDVKHLANNVWLSEQSPLAWFDAKVSPITVTGSATATPTLTLTPPITDTPTVTSTSMPSDQGIVWDQSTCRVTFRDTQGIKCDFPNPKVLHFVYKAPKVNWGFDFTFRVYDTLKRPVVIKYVTYFTAKLQAIPVEGKNPVQCFYGWYTPEVCGPLGSAITGSFENQVWGGGFGNNFIGAPLREQGMSGWLSGYHNVEAWLSIDAPYDPPVCSGSSVCCFKDESSSSSSMPSGLAEANPSRVVRQAALLYRLRDEAMKNTTEGQRYIDLYYAHTAEFVSIFFEDSALLGQGLDVIDVLAPNLQALLDGNGSTVTVTSEQVQQAQAFLDALLLYASPELKQDIERERQTHPLDEIVGMNMDEAWNHIFEQGIPSTFTPTFTATDTLTPTLTDTSTSTSTPTDTPTNTETPTLTPTDTPTPTPTDTPTPTFTNTPTISPSTVTITVMDENSGKPLAWVLVSAYRDGIYTDESGFTDANGQVLFSLSPGAYSFSATSNGQTYWSGDEGHCTVPGCSTIGIAIPLSPGPICPRRQICPD